MARASAASDVMDAADAGVAGTAGAGSGTPDAGSGTTDAGAAGAPALSDRDRAMLEFERQWWKFAGSKEEAIRQQFDMSGTRYFQILNDLIDRPEALATDPLLVKRLRRMRSSKQKARAARNLGMRLD